VRKQTKNSFDNYIGDILKDGIVSFLDNLGIRHRMEQDKFILKGSGSRIRIPPVNEDIAYALGYVCGDGCLSSPQPRKNKGGFRFKIAICFSSSEKGKSRAMEISKIFRQHFNYAPRLIKIKGKGRQDWFSMEITSAVIYAYFFQLGLPVGTKYGKLNVPPAVLKKRLFKEFLRGLIDSDGHIGKDGRIWIVQKDSIFRNKVRELSLQFLNIRFSNPRPNTKRVGDRIYTWYYMMTFMADKVSPSIFTRSISMKNEAIFKPEENRLYVPG